MKLLIIWQSGMIYKSYIVENNEQIFTCKSFLFYGENLGL